MNDSNSTLANDLPVSSGPRIKSGWARALLFFLLLIPTTLVSNLIIFFVLSMAGLEIGLTSVDDLGLAIITVVFGLIIISLVFLVRLTIDRRSVVSLGFTWNKKYKRDLLAGIALGFGLLTAIFMVLVGAGLIEIVSFRLPFLSIGTMIVIFTLVAFQEEIVTRGYLLQNLMQSVPKHLALLLVSLIFGIAHIFNPNLSVIAFCNILLAGILLGIYYIYRRNLWFPIGLHLSWNLCQGAIFGSPVSGARVKGIIEYEVIGSDLLTGGAFGLEGSIVTTFVLAVGIVFLHLTYRDRVIPIEPDLERPVNLPGL